jgi:uncharacterized protein DUF397
MLRSESDRRLSLDQCLPGSRRLAGHSAYSEANSGRGLAAVRVGGRVTEFEKPSIVWRKSRASNSGACVEVAAVGGSVLVRDSANRDGTVLRWSAAAWSAFVMQARERHLG